MPNVIKPWDDKPHDISGVYDPYAEHKRNMSEAERMGNDMRVKLVTHGVSCPIHSSVEKLGLENRVILPDGTLRACGGLCCAHFLKLDPVHPGKLYIMPGYIHLCAWCFKRVEQKKFDPWSRTEGLQVNCLACIGEVITKVKTTRADDFIDLAAASVIAPIDPVKDNPKI